MPCFFHINKLYKKERVKWLLIKNQDVKVFATRIAGVSYEDRQTIIEQVTDETPLVLKREPRNPYDAHAIAVMAYFRKEEKKIGYIPREIAKDLAKKMDEGAFVLVQFIEKKTEQYSAADYSTGSLNDWSFTGVIVGIMC